MFKNKQGDGHEALRKSTTSAKDQGHGSARLLQSDEIKSICDEHHLDRHEVYNIRSQFASMVKMSKTHEEQ